MFENKPKSSNRNRLIIASEIGLLLLIAVFLIFGRDIDNDEAQANNDTDRVLIPSDVTGAAEVGLEAPDFSLATVDGEQITLSELRGRPVIINFWATWCAPCRFEMPEFQETVEAYSAENLQLLAINREESHEQIIDFFNELSAEKEIAFTFPSLLDRRSDVAKAYGVFNMPTTFFVDANGIVTAVHFGQLDRAQIDRYLADTFTASTN